MPRPGGPGLPPLPPARSGQMWPARGRPGRATPSTARAGSGRPGGRALWRANTAALPLSTSAGNTTGPGPCPSGRSTLVAPCGADVRAVDSPQRPASQPNGIEARVGIPSDTKGQKRVHGRVPGLRAGWWRGSQELVPPRGPIRWRGGESEPEPGNCRIGNVDHCSEANRSR